ncbi:LAGLIDADG family homing endonuclease (plasmid) [Peribacillus frigoritolerans]|nr:LAGLIDADG family homing endonuclease [Peribacillus frigoritolerans]
MTFLGDHTKNNNIPQSSNLKVKPKISLYNDFSSLKIKRSSINKQATLLRRYHTERTNQLGPYLAGLVEGDGSIILRKGDKEKISPKFVFTFGKKELKMYERLQGILSTGSINIEKTGICRYSITNADAVINLINMVNGKFRTPKIIALHKAIDNLNK